MQVTFVRAAIAAFGSVEHADQRSGGITGVELASEHEAQHNARVAGKDAGVTARVKTTSAGRPASTCIGAGLPSAAIGAD
jgi:hypothetical protein